MPKILFVAPIYNYEPILVPALRLQTCANWELILVHDGPNRTGVASALSTLNDHRIRYYETLQRYDDWGHSLRAIALERIATEPISGDFIVVTNADNYYCPDFIYQMVSAFRADVVATYCRMSHSHQHWAVIDSKLQHARIDCGCVMVRRDALLAVGWKSRDYSADWVCIAELVERFGVDAFVKIDNVLFVHN